MSKTGLYWIEPGSPADNFPPIDSALDQPDGLLCFGGDLSPERLMAAYRRGIFPWYCDPQPIMWWSPQPRCVLFPDQLRVSRSLKKSLRNKNLEISMDQAFTQVVGACAQPRPAGSNSDTDGSSSDADTWITIDMQAAYGVLHTLGHAHSVEVWQHGKLVGGLYGIACGQLFFGESMFSRISDASKVALYCLTKRLAAHGFQLIDCQVSSAHLYRLGAQDIGRSEFGAYLSQYSEAKNTLIAWPHDRSPASAYDQGHE